ncbi:MAG: response regulator, partial [Candidatus Symbiothrix sp.]|nr:response regulator [Candidatus Symbiothrix sp.]
DEIGTNFVYTINEDSEGNIWTGGKKGKISKLDIRSQTFTQFALTQANYILTADKVVFVAAESGIFKIAEQNGEYIQYRFSRNLKSSFINDMYLESDSIIWMATYGDGLNRYNLETREVHSFTMKNGLASDFIYSILTANDDLWLSSENGLIRFNMKNYTAVNYSEEDGLSSNKFRQLSRRKGNDENLYFGSYDGVTYFNPIEIGKEEESAKLFFQNFYLFNKIVKPGDKNSPLTASIDQTSRIRLRYTQHSFSLNFTTIDFSSNTNRRYMWKLEGLDKEWIAPTSENTANYTNIGNGKYTFVLRNIGNDNTILDERRITIEVIPPFWETVWARCLFIVILLIMAYLVYRYTKQRIERKHSEEKMQFFIHTAHDIRTPLTLISAPIYQLKEEIQNPSKNIAYLLDLITQNLKKLNDNFSQLLDFQKAYEWKDQLTIRKHNVNQYLSEKFRQWEQSALKKQISFRLILPSETLQEGFDTDKMDKIIDNLLSNAVKYTPEKGNITVELQSDEKHWRLKIADSGIGILRKDRKNLFRRFFRAENAINTRENGSGLGLLLVKRYVDLHRGSIQIKSAESKGAEFILNFLHNVESLHASSLPANNNTETADYLESETESPQHPLHKIKVLIVEDNDDLCCFMQKSYESVYQVFTASDGVEAWKNILKINPDMVISDLQMPRMDGFELSAKIKNTFETSHIPIILLTVVDDRHSVEKAFQIGVDDYIEKPFELKYLQLKMENIIQNRKILRSKFLGIDKSLDDTHSNELNKRFIEQASSIIDRHIADSQYSIADFSKEMGLSKSLLYTKFNAITGYTPNDFIKILRMKKSVDYFQQKKYTINEVAFMVGFEDPAYFSNCFKKIYGASPKSFIEKNL